MQIYTKKKPRKPGYYWVKDSNGLQEKLFWIDSNTKLGFYDWTYFCGPIEPPKSINMDNLMQEIRNCKLANFREKLEKNPELAYQLQQALIKR